MTDLLKIIEVNFTKVYKFIENDYRLQLMIKTSIAVSTLSLIALLYYLKRRPKFIVSYETKNIGFLGLVKHDIRRYNFSLTKKLDHNPIKKHFSFPNGITNFGNNCYINVLLHVI
jgi:ubiquitin C-terminal hydrolase